MTDRRVLFAEAAAEMDADVLLLNASMRSGVEDKVRAVIEARESRRQKVIVILVTSGGMPDVAYRLAMTLHRHYLHVTICIAGWCKSAGTLLAISGHSLIMGSQGEMGPLDVQIAKRDDLGGDRDSGLVINEALARLREESFELFSEFMLRLISQSANLVTLRTAADISAQLTIGLMSPIFEKIDPMRMGADARAMNIGEEYAIRLNAKGQNLRGTDALSMLLNGYPSHSFVIDFNEAAQSLFTDVKPLDGKLAEAVRSIGPVALRPVDNSIICFMEGDDRGEPEGTEVAEEQLPEPSGDNDDVDGSDAGSSAENV